MMGKREPTVSVVMKVYNGERFLREAVDSVLSQTYTDFELLVIDDGSTDHSVEIIQSYDDERIHLLQNEKNMGLCATQNKVIDAARGKYIAVLDCDDISYPTRLSEQVAYLDEHIDTIMCGTFRNDIVDGKECFFREPVQMDNATLCFSLVFGNFFFTHSSIMFRAKEYRENNLSYGPTSIAEDYQIIVEMAKRYPIALIPKCLVGYRIDQQSISHRKEKEITDAGRRVKTDYLESLPVEESAKEILRDYFLTGIAKQPVFEFILSMRAVAEYMGADISRTGNAYSVACEIVREYVLRTAHYNMSVWRQLRESEYKDVVSLKSIMGWRTLAMCVLKYRRETYAN